MPDRPVCTRWRQPPAARTRAGATAGQLLPYPRATPVPDLADHAYALACAVLGPGDGAAEAAADGLRRGGRARWAVLGHTRHAVLERSADADEPGLDAPAPDELTELAILLASTRPALERLVVDLDARHALDRGGLARALGLPAAAAARRVGEVVAGWQDTLDPVVLARLGPGGCDGLAMVLGGGDSAEVPGGPASPPQPTLRQVVDLGPAVADHAAGCPACRDRLRAMVSVRTLLGQRPLEAAPASVRSAAAASRLRRPAPPPPLVPLGPLRRSLRPVLVVAAVTAFAVAGGAIASMLESPAPPTSIEALTRLPAAGSALVARPALVEGPLPPPVSLENQSDRELTWEARPDAPWLLVEPAGGILEPGAATTIRLAVAPDAPEGEARGAVRISSADGSMTIVRLTATVERPPDVAASLTGCTVTASVEDEGQVRSVELHRVEVAPGGRPNETTASMDPTTDGYVGRLPSSAASQSWWVVAVDARGNAARTPSGTRPPGDCP